MAAKPECRLCNGIGMCRSPGDWRENGGWEACPACYPPQPKQPGLFQRAWRYIQARYRLDLNVVCEMSKERGPHADFHDYPDDEHGQPWHFVPLKCKRCGKEFFI